MSENKEASTTSATPPLVHSASLPSSSGLADTPKITKQLSADSGAALLSDSPTTQASSGAPLATDGVPPPPQPLLSRSLSVQEKAALRRAAILQRGSSRMALVSGSATDQDMTALNTPAPVLVAAASAASSASRLSDATGAAAGVDAASSSSSSSRATGNAENSSAQTPPASSNPSTPSPPSVSSSSSSSPSALLTATNAAAAAAGGVVTAKSTSSSSSSASSSFASPTAPRFILVAPFAAMTPAGVDRARHVTGAVASFLLGILLSLGTVDRFFHSYISSSSLSSPSSPSTAGDAHNGESLGSSSSSSSEGSATISAFPSEFLVPAFITLHAILWSLFASLKRMVTAAGASPQQQQSSGGSALSPAASAGGSGGGINAFLSSLGRRGSGSSGAAGAGGGGASSSSPLLLERKTSQDLALQAAASAEEADMPLPKDDIGATLASFIDKAEQLAKANQHYLTMASVALKFSAALRWLADAVCVYLFSFVMTSAVVALFQSKVA